MRETVERGAINGCGQCRELLPWYVADVLAPPESDFVAEHLAICADCAHELATWRDLAHVVVAQGNAVRPVFTAAVAAERFSVLLGEMVQEQVDPIAAVVSDATPAISHVTRKMDIAVAVADLAAAGAHFWRVLAAQAWLLRRGMWVASALGIVLAALYAALVPTVSATSVLTFALPLIAATGAAFLYGPDNDPALELALGTPTSARAVLFGRFLLLFGYNTAIALAATALVAASRGEDIVLLALSWFGPLALLSTVSLALSLVVNPIVAGSVAAALWLSRMLRFDDGASLRFTPAMLWHTSPQILAISLGLLLLTLLYVPRQQRFASEEHLS